MRLKLLESPEVDPAEIAAANARCYLALGRLDGAIAHAAKSRRAVRADLLALWSAYGLETGARCAWLNQYLNPLIIEKNSGNIQYVKQ